MNPDQDKTERAILEKYVDEIKRLQFQPPDPTAHLLFRGHALIDQWLDRYISLINSIKPIPADDERLSSLSPSYKAFYSTLRPPLDPTLGFMGKLRKIEPLGIMPAEIVVCSELVNKIRNNYVHDFDYQVTRKDVEFILKALLRDPQYNELYKKTRPSLTDDYLVLTFVFAQILIAFMGIHVVLRKISKLLQ